MNQLRKKIVFLTALLSAGHLCAVSTITKLIPRSQSLNAARQIVGWNNPEWGINRKPQDERYSSFNLIFEYTRTFRGDRLAKCFFGDDLVCNCDDQNALIISGSGVADVTGTTREDIKYTSLRSGTDWLADYFGLPINYKGTVCFNPRIDNFILDFSYYIGLDEWYEGMYFRIHGPFVHTRWRLGATETSGTAGNASELQQYTNPGQLYPAGYFAPSEVTDYNTLNCSFLQYANGGTPTLPDDVKWQPLCCSRIVDDCECGSLTRNGFGEIRFALGRNFINEENGDHHLGLGVYVAAPTGTRVEGRYLFEPIVGNGKHWELGAHITGHRIWWRNEEEDRSFGMYLEANISHLFNACQTRCFDLCSAGSNSRYMLAQRLESNRSEDPRIAKAGDPQGTPLFVAFANEFAPVANITRREINSSYKIQGDVAFTLSYQRENFQWDLGYNFWGRSCEQISLNRDCCPVIHDMWALKGTNFVYGFEQADEILYPYDEMYPGDPVALAATDSKATINGTATLRPSCGNITVPSGLGVKNIFADNACNVTTNNNKVAVISPTAIDEEDYRASSVQPVLIKEDDFDYTGLRGISNKIFTHFNWARPDRENSDWTPYIGIGAEAEFGKTERDCCAPKCCDTTCDTGCAPSCTPDKNTNCCPEFKKCCVDCALTQWGVWLKMGASYN